MGTNKRRFLLVAKVPRTNCSEEVWMMIPVDSIEAINWVKNENENVEIYYRFYNELYSVDVKQSFSDISNGKCTVEL